MVCLGKSRTHRANTLRSKLKKKWLLLEIKFEKGDKRSAGCRLGTVRVERVWLGKIFLLRFCIE